MLVAQRGKTSRVEEFFQAGRNIGFPLFTHTTWGTSFAFGNSIFYATWLGYTMGLSALWPQALWAIGMICYALLLPRLIIFTQDFTLHGFLGSTFGPACRVTASLVSVFGFLVCLGFEISFAARYFAQITNLQHLEWIVVIIFAVFIATFCSIGGFKANTLTDRISNYLALGTMFVLPLLIIARHSDKLGVGFSGAAIWKSMTDFSSVSWIYLIGLGCFSLFNIVDMSNWQNVSANSLTANNREQGKKMRKAMVKASGLFLIAPVFTGTLIGYMLRILNLGTSDQSAFMSKMTLNLLPSDSLISLCLLAPITFSFMAASLSGTDTWLLASTQTLSWDLFDFKHFKERKFRVQNFEKGLHESITGRARVILLLLGVGGASFVYFISKIWNDVFSLQFVIFGGGLAMLPPLLYGVLVNPQEKSKILSTFSLLAIAVGYSTVIALFVYSLVMKNPALVEPIPIIALGVSSLFFISGLLIQGIKRKLGRHEYKTTN